MTYQRRSLLTSFLWFFVAQASTNVDQIIGTKGETFLRKLKYNVEKHEECREREKTPNHAFFRIAGKCMAVKDFYNLYQSLFTTSNPEEMVSVITIRNIHKKSFEANDYMKTIVNGLQHCVNNTENSIVIDGLVLTIDHFNLEYLDEFNRQTQYIEQVSSIHKECEVLFINNSYKICFDALKSQLLDQIEIKLSFCGIPRDSYYYYLLNATQQEDFKLKSWQILESLIEKIKEGRYTAFFPDKRGNTETTFKKMYLELCCFEEKIQCNYFSGNYDQFRKFLLFLVQIEHMKSVNERATDLALQYVKIFELAEVKEMMIRFFTDIYIEFLQICMKAGIHFRSNEFYQTRNRFFEEEYFQEKLQNFFDNLPANDIKDRHCTKYRIANDMIRQEIEFEQVTKIFCNKEICSESLYELCSILGERKIYNGFDYQFIYIDYGRIASDFDTNKCVSMCDNILFESSDKKKIVEFIATIVPQSIDDGSTALQYFQYLSGATLTRDRSNLSCAKKTKEPNDTAITIDEYDKAGFVIASKEHVKTLTDKCLTTWKDCKILDRHVVHVAKRGESYIIHAIQLKQKNRVHENLLLIYDIPVASKSTKQLDYQHVNRRFVCHNNVPIHFVNNLMQNLQFLQLTEHADFKIPNECSLSNIGPMLNHDFEGTEGILGYYDKADLKAFIYYHTKIGYCCYKSLFIQDIDKHKTDRRQISEYLKRIIEKFGLEEAMFVRIVSDFTKSVRSVDDALTGGNRRGKLSDNYKYKLIATIQNDESLNLRICRSVNNFYIDSVLLTTQKIFDTISKIKDVSPTFQNLDRIARFYNCKIPFFTLFYHNLFRQINYFTFAYYQYTSVLTGNECLRVIYESIESLFINICEMSNKSGIDIPETEVYHLSNVQKSINPKEIGKLAMQLANDINKSVFEKKIKVTSIKLKKTEDKCVYEIFERFAETLYYDPENTSLDDEH